MSSEPTPDRPADQSGRGDIPPPSSSAPRAGASSGGAGNGGAQAEPLSSPESWSEFDRVNVDLSDVIGTLGLPEPLTLAERLAGAFDGAVEQLARSDRPFLYGEFAHRLLGAPQGQASGFLDEMDRALPDARLSSRDATVLVQKESVCGRHLVVQQTLHGAEVVGARMDLHIDDDNRVYAVTGQPVGDLPVRDPGELPRTSDLEAIEAIRAHFGLSREIRIEVQRVIFPLPAGSVWAFEGRFTLYDPIVNVRAYIQADDQSLMLSYNIASAALLGEALTYPVNPLRTPNLQTVRLDHLGPVPVDRLAGSVIDVRPRDGAPFSHVFRDCRLAPEDLGFDEVQAYYHLSNAVRFFGFLGGRLLNAAPFTPMKAIVRDNQSPNNAYFIPDTGELLFGDFDSRPTARSAEIIYHEFAHAVSDAICRLGRSPTLHTPARGMNEGYSDYFAASALDDPRIGDYVTNRPTGARDCSKPDLRFPPSFQGREHAMGEVWAAVLWGIRSRCGAGVSDIIALESLQFVDRSSTFEDGCAALITADRRLFPTPDKHGRHEEIINEEFEKRRP